MKLRSGVIDLMTLLERVPLHCKRFGTTGLDTYIPTQKASSQLINPLPVLNGCKAIYSPVYSLFKPQI